MQKKYHMPQGRGKHAPANEGGLTDGNDQTPKDNTTPGADFTPTNPQPGTQAARLLRALQQGRAVDPLRGLGWLIRTDGISVKNQFGEVCKVASYRLEVLP